MELSEFISVNNEHIVRAWEEFAKALSGNVALPRWLLRDHADAIVKLLARQMAATSASDDHNATLGTTSPIENLAAAHVKIRISSGFDLAQIVSEYCGLRACVVRLWREQAPADFKVGAPEIVRFNGIIDEHITAAVISYKEEENQYRDRFLGMLGHDLRNPINAVMLGITSLANQGLSERQLNTLARIQNGARRLSGMVDDLVDFTRGRLGSPIPITRSAANLAILVREIVDEVQLANPRCAIECQTEPELNGEWDSARLKQLFSNLLLNAIQHGTGDRVRITAKIDGSSVVVEVHNSGPAIPADLQATIFEPMVRARASAQDRNGLGLGLFIAREIVSAHHGTISVTSSDKAGTSFVMRLPRDSAT
jgi:signal transduction histidine kinase